MFKADHKYPVNRRLTSVLGSIRLTNDNYQPKTYFSTSKTLDLGCTHSAWIIYVDIYFILRQPLAYVYVYSISCLALVFAMNYTPFHVLLLY